MLLKTFKRIFLRTFSAFTTVCNSTQLNSTGHVTLTAKRDQKKGKKQQLINIPYL